MSEGEVGEDGDEPTEDGDLWIEAKSFTKLFVDGYLLIKETYRKGTREICLSAKQLDWICGVLVEKFEHFGVAKRRVSKRFEGGAVSIFEGSNVWGKFISIQVKVGSAEPNFVVIPAGNLGRNWGSFTKWLQSGSAVKGKTMLREDANPELVAPPCKGRSYVEVVKSGQAGIGSIDVINALKDQIIILNGKLEAVLIEFAAWRSSQLDGFPVRSSGVSPGGFADVDGKPGLSGEHGLTAENSYVSRDSILDAHGRDVDEDDVLCSHVPVKAKEPGCTGEAVDNTTVDGDTNNYLSFGSGVSVEWNEGPLESGQTEAHGLFGESVGSPQQCFNIGACVAVPTFCPGINLRKSHGDVTGDRKDATDQDGDAAGVDAPVPPDPGTRLGTETGLCPPESNRPRLGTVPATTPANVPAIIPATVPAIFPEFFSENVPAPVPTTSCDASFVLSTDMAHESKSSVCFGTGGDLSDDWDPGIDVTFDPGMGNLGPLARSLDWEGVPVLSDRGSLERQALERQALVCSRREKRIFLRRKAREGCESGA